MSIDEGVHYEASLDKVRIAYACYHDDYQVKGRTTEEWWQIRDEACAEFDRWLDQVKADAWDEGWSEGLGVGRDDFDALSLDDNPYRKEQANDR